MTEGAFYVFTKEYDIIYMSDFFIPSINDDFYPYLLVFPTGFTEYDDKYFISYGEGDERCKILELSKNSIKNLLKVDNFKLKILKKEHLLPKILHVGYFNKYNAGDDVFMLIFKYLNKKNNAYKSHYIDKGYDYKTLMLGGGDVINNYFCDKINYNIKNKIAYGVGIPYLNLMHLLNNFNKIILRSPNDYDDVINMTNITNNNIVVKHQPDISWMVLDYYKPKKIFGNNKTRIGFALPRTYHNSSCTNEYISLVYELYNFIKLLIENEDVIVYLIPFCINLGQNEDDNILNNQLFDLLIINSEIETEYIDDIKFVKSNNVIKCSLMDNLKDCNYVYKLFNIINSMDLMICGRYHAHQFSAICNTSFISLSCSRKCEELMKEWDMSEYHYKFETNNLIIPINLNSCDLFEWFKEIDKKKLKKKINDIHINKLKIKEMINDYYDIILK